MFRKNTHCNKEQRQGLMRLPDLTQLPLQPQIALDIKHILHKYNKPHGLQHLHQMCKFCKFPQLKKNKNKNVMPCLIACRLLFLNGFGRHLMQPIRFKSGPSLYHSQIHPLNANQNQKYLSFSEKLSCLCPKNYAQKCFFMPYSIINT